MSLLLILVFGGLVSVWNWKIESELTKLTVQNNALERAIQNQNDVINQLLTRISQLESDVVTELTDQNNALEHELVNEKDVINQLLTKISQLESARFAESSTTRAVVRSTPKGMDSTEPSIIESSAFEDCEDIRSRGYDVSGVYDVNSENSQITRVYCEMTSDGKAWTRILHRQDNLTDFVYKTWIEYEAGFGDPQGSHWMGLVQMHQLTTDYKYKLRVDLEDWEGYTAYAEYSTFSLGSAKLKYRLFIGNYSGTAGDSLTGWHNNSRFSTIDQDNHLRDFDCDDPEGTGEGNDWYGGWWSRVKNCFWAHLTASYRHSGFVRHNPRDDGILWVGWRGWSYAYRVATMKMQRL